MWPIRLLLATPDDTPPSVRRFNPPSVADTSGGVVVVNRITSTSGHDMAECQDLAPKALPVR